MRFQQACPLPNGTARVAAVSDGQQMGLAAHNEAVYLRIATDSRSVRLAC